MGDDADWVRRLLAARVPELSEAEIAEALLDGVLGDIIDAAGEAIEARLDQIEQSLTASAARDEVSDYVEDAEDTTTVEREAERAFARRVA
jgi:hypothetical protein